MRTTTTLKGVAELAISLSRQYKSGEQAVRMASRLNGWPNRAQLNSAIRALLKNTTTEDREKLGPVVGLH